MAQVLKMAINIQVLLISGNQLSDNRFLDKGSAQCYVEVNASVASKRERFGPLLL
jgi:hypothetical protein